MLTVTILKGLPGSGKSTWAREQVRKNPNGVKRINKDDLRAMLDDSQYTGKSEKFIISVRDVLIQHTLAEGKHVIVDDTNLNPIHEEQISILAARYGARVEVKEFDIPVEECIKNDLKRLNSVGKDVIMDMYKKYMLPNTVADDRENYLSFDNSKDIAIIIDVDGTVAHNDGHRGWHDYAKVVNDKPIQTNIEIIRAVLAATKAYPIFLSGRQDSCRTETLYWIHEHVVPHLTTEDFSLLMRDAEDFRKDSIIKKEIYDKYIAPIYNILVAFDDRDQVVNMWRENGIRCYQVANGNF